MVVTEAENDFETKALESLNRTESRQETILKDISRINGELKQALADLDAAKKTANEFQISLARVQRELSREVDRNWKNPVDRFCAAPERAALVRAWFKSVHPAFQGQLTPLEKDTLLQFIAAKTAVQAGDSSLGGAVDPTSVYNQIYDALLNYGQWNTLGIVPVGTRTETIPLVTARPTAYWINTQGGQITEGAITGTTVTLTIREAAAWIPAANAILEDAAVNLSAYLLEQLAMAVAYRLDWACFAADGTNDVTDGNFTGIASGGTAATAGAGNTTVAELDLEDFVRCLTTVSAGLLQRSCKWWIHPQVLAKVCQIRDLNGRSLFQNALEAPAPGAVGSILGYPVIPTAAMPSTDSAGNVVACFGDPQGGAVGIRRQFDYAQSTDFQFDYYRTAFRVVIRAGFIIKAATSFAKLTLAAA